MAWPFPPKRVLYALKILSCLACAEGPARARDLARCTGIPPAETAKVLYLLTWRGLVSSRRGSKGGFWLRLPPNRIRIQNVMEFFQPPDDRPRKDSKDPMLRLWQETTGTSPETLHRLTVADLMEKHLMTRCSKLLESEGGGWRFFA